MAINKRKRNQSSNRSTDAGNKSEQYKINPNTGTKPANPKPYGKPS
jgi:hypothetical protein